MTTFAQKIVDVDALKPLDATVSELQLQRLPLIILLGDFSPALEGYVRSFCSRVIAPIAVDPGALIFDKGIRTGCAAIMGQAAIDQDDMPPLIGVVPNSAGPDNIDENHGIVLRLPAVWPDLPKYMFQIADRIVKDGTDSRPALALLFGGNGEERKAVIRCARRNWPVVVTKGTGGLADEIISAAKPGDGAAPAPIQDPELREIVETATIYSFSVDEDMDDLKRILLGRFERGSGTLAVTLTEAWRTYTGLDSAAIVKQESFRRLELILIVLGVLAALFAILSIANPFPQRFLDFIHGFVRPETLSGTLRILVILTPIAISIFSAYNSHFRDGNKWLLLRGAAEAVKREIFKFRTRAGIYSDDQCLETSRESKLVAKIKDVTSALGQSEVNKTSVGLGSTASPQPTNFLTPDEYVEMRIHDQIHYFAGKTRSLSQRLIWMQAAMYVAGGAGTFLAAMNQAPWVAVATAIVTALATKLQADQVENSLVQYNQALASLCNIELWWQALSTWEKSRRRNIDLLVEQTEKTLESETAGWIQQLQSALDKLTEKEPESKENRI